MPARTRMFSGLPAYSLWFLPLSQV
jgi:hypothetical protein